MIKDCVWKTFATKHNKNYRGKPTDTKQKPGS